ncbi:MAG TPA: hypothetical protein VJR27_05450 [Candidatus Saccharimonadales bacterium]|nr:hypothetical protein [Candidatus Saccharimonadales bacterium]
MGGSWGTLLEAMNFMDENNLGRPMQVGQAYHIGRIGMQADRLGMRSVIPDGLPRNFDRSSAQIWTRSMALWAPREVLGSMVLRKQGKL